MKKMYIECHLVHADLSEFNLLWHEGTVYVIDVAQSVDSIQSKALEFLMRDCLNVTKVCSVAKFTNLNVKAVIYADRMLDTSTIICISSRPGAVHKYYSCNYPIFWVLYASKYDVKALFQSVYRLYGAPTQGHFHLKVWTHMQINL